MDTMNVKTPGGSYPLFQAEGVLAQAGNLLQQRGFSGPCAVVTNPTVGDHYAATVLNSLTRHGFRPALCHIPDGERHKTLATVSDLYTRFWDAGLERQSPVLALGGGVVGDIAGFAAATYLRGLPFVQIPTTLLAMVDAGVGGKTGVDLPQGKNMVGAFKQPELVLVDAAVLRTLPAAEFRAGLAEVLKHSIIAGPELFRALGRGDFELSWMIVEAIKIKAQIVEGDPFEQGRRAVLNLGHTFGHAFEHLSGYRMRHGEGVAAGLACAARLAAELGHCAPATARHIIAALEHLDLPAAPPNYPPDAVWQAMMADKKKKEGRLRFILPRAVGDVDIFNNVPEAAVKAILKS
ncbi:MAG: 3-dehydroquinate synthase [Anaerolineae bacterium]